jgi:hypothetical protein
MFVLGTAGFLLSCLHSLFAFSTIRPLAVRVSSDVKPLEKNSSEVLFLPYFSYLNKMG